MANDVKAPYADIPIPMHLGSTTGMKYRTISCLECGREFLDRQADVIYRVGDSLAPNEIHVGREDHINAMCANCNQRYTLTVSINVQYVQNSVPLYMQPESLYISPQPSKHLRFVHCMECGKAFHSISDRISKVVDNRVPFEYLDPLKLGPVQVMCHYNNCSQEWAIML